MWIVDCAGPLAEIALQHLRGWNRVEAGKLPSAQIELIVIDEEKRFVASVVNLGNPNRTAEREAVLVLVPESFGRAEEAASIEDIVVVELKSVAVKLVRAALHSETGDPGQGVRVLRRVVIRNQLVFGDRVHGRVDFSVVREIASGKRDAIEVNLIVERAAAADMLLP